ncbi:hypothetical protein [Endothiovibrio diazotrophicus]
MTKLQGEAAEGLWWDSAQFVHDLYNRFLALEGTALALERDLSELVNKDEAAAPRRGPQVEMDRVARQIEVIIQETQLARMLTNLHWDRVDGGLQAPERRWVGNGGKTVQQARERLERELEEIANGPTWPYAVNQAGINR